MGEVYLTRNSYDLLNAINQSIESIHSFAEYFVNLGFIL